MKRWVFTGILLILSGLGIQAQVHLASSGPAKIKYLLNKADHYFEWGAYAHAAEFYRRSLVEYPHEDNIKLRLGDCFRELSDDQRAVFWYGQVLPKNKTSVQHLLHYANSLTALRFYDQALVWYQEYLKREPRDQRALTAIANLKNLGSLLKNDYIVREFLVTANGPVFSPAFLDDGLVFVSYGNTGGLAKKVATWSERPYYDLYFTPVINGRAGFPRYLSKRLNSVLHEGPADFYDKGYQVIFTRTSSINSSRHTKHLQLMWAEKDAHGNWSKPQKLPLNDNNYSVGHPAISSRGDTLYFSSDMPGGFGGTDIYRSLLKDGKWDTPVNLGSTINTTGDEMFPTLGASGLLYFASNGQGGLGGLDMFVVQLSGHDPPKNLGYPLNSSKDDFSIIWGQQSKWGYFSSNRTGQDKIFEFWSTEEAVN